ncbi:DUF5694 domain-containing protein [Maricaulis sp. CAU 1757]
MMKLAAALASIALLASPACSQADGTQTASTHPEVMVLGTFHFTGGGQDMINPQVDDFLSDRRQAEIAVVLDRLESFAPTRILVELTPEHEAEFNALYQAYLAGDHALTVNERQQLGMALAARLGHDRLYAVDYQNGMDFQAMLSAAEAAGQTALLDHFQTFMAEVQPHFEAESAPERTVLERLLNANSAYERDLHDIYLLTAQMGSADNPVGAEQMVAWWGRNLHIFANISRHAEPDERLLVIYGGGHKYLLDQFIDRAPNLAWVDAMTVLADG